MNDNAKAAGLAKHEWVNLSRQLQDVGTMAAMGASPMMILTSQGAQIADVFSSSGAGAGAALKDFGVTALRVAVHPLTLLTGAIGVATLAWMKFDAEQRAIERSLNGVGRAAGVTAEQLRGIGVAGAAAGGFGGSQGLDLAGRYAGAGIRGGNIQSLVENTQRFARGFGVSLDDAAQEISQIVGDSSLGAMEKRFGAIDFATKEMVRSLEQSGRYAEAQAAAVARLAEEIGKAKETSSELEKIWEKIKTWATTPLFGLGPTIDRLKNGPSLQEQIAAARGEFFNLRARRGASESAYPGETAAAARVRDLERQIEEPREAARRAARDLEMNRLSQDAAAAARRLSPESFEKRDLEGQQSLLRRALGEPETVRKMGDAAIGARSALAHLTTQIENWQSALEKQRGDAALAVREIGARTYAEREAVAMERARVQTLRETGDVTRAALAVETERAKMHAEAARKVDDLVRTSADNLRLAKMSPFERRQAEIDIAERKFREENLPSVASPMAEMFNSAADAARKLVDAFLEQAGRIGGEARSLPIFARTGSGGGSLYDAIIRAEGTGRFGDPYNTSLGYMRSPKPLVEMTMRESLAWGDRVRAVQGLNSSAKGAFQITNTTQRDAMRALGLGENAMFSPDNQRRMADWIALKQGLGAWEGFKLHPGDRTAAANALSSRTTVGFGDQRAQNTYETFQKPLEDSNKEIERQRDLLRVQVATFGQSTEAVARATKQQELYNQFTAQGANENSLGKQKFDELRASISDTAANYGRLTVEQERSREAQSRYISDLDLLRGTSRDVLGGLASGLMNAKSAGEALRETLSRIGDRLMSHGIDRLIGAALGNQGSANLGLLGNLFGGGAAGGGAGIFGGLLSGIGNFFGFADGGVVGAPGGRMAPAPLSAFVGAPHFASGGAVPVIAHAGEVILNAAQQANVAVAIKAARRAANSNNQQSPTVVVNMSPVFNNADPSTEARLRAQMAEMERSIKRDMPGILAARQARGLYNR
jgi:hypothetical protein